LQSSESPAWSKYFELAAESESVTFFREIPNRGTDGLFGILLTENVSLATDQTQIPFGFPVINSANKDGSGSFLGFAQDTGGVIKGAHIDVFVGDGEIGWKRTNQVSRIGAARILVPKSCEPKPVIQ
jgi:membrane-bound lytic murein transglycosylase